MSLSVTLLSTSDDPRVVTKSTTTIAAVTAKPTQDCSVLNPRLILHYTGSLVDVNYLYISDFDKYYYIDQIKLLPGNQIELAASIDVLKTYDAEIRGCMATVVRSESVGAPTMIPDNKLPINPNKKELKTAVYQFKGSAAADVHTPRYFMKIKYSPTAYIPNSERGEDNADK